MKPTKKRTRKLRTPPTYAPSPLTALKLYYAGRMALALLDEMLVQDAVRLPFPRFGGTVNNLRDVIRATVAEESAFIRAHENARRGKR